MEGQSTALPKRIWGAGGWQLGSRQHCALAAQRASRTLGCIRRCLCSVQGSQTTRILQLPSNSKHLRFPEGDSPPLPGAEHPCTPSAPHPPPGGFDPPPLPARRGAAGVRMNAGLFCCCSGLGRCGTGRLVGTALGGCAAPRLIGREQMGARGPVPAAWAQRASITCSPLPAGSACLAQSSAMEPAGPGSACMGSACLGSTPSAVGTGQGDGFKVKEERFGSDMKGKSFPQRR